MNIVDRALETQLKNIQARTGKSLDQLYALIRKSGLTKHGQIRDMLKRDLGMGHGDANTLVTFYLKSQGQPGAPIQAPAPAEAVDAIYTGAKADLRPIHDKLMAAIARFGPFEISPKKTYLSLRRKKQFAMIGPAARSRVEVGLNMKGVKATPRLTQMPAGEMCQYRVHVADLKSVDKELIGWIKKAYDSSG